jgi:hypothetical protein
MMTEKDKQELAMYLSKREIKVLRHLQKHRDAPPTFFGEIRSVGLWLWITYSLLIPYVVVVMVSRKLAGFEWFALGLISGVCYTLLIRLRRSLELWRLTRQVTDWKRVDELIRENE